MADQPARFWCAQCGREVPASEIAMFHSLGRMHTVCRSGKVTPIQEDK